LGSSLVLTSRRYFYQPFLTPALFLRPISHYFFQARGKHQNNRSLVRPPFILGLEFAGIVVSAPIGSQYSPGDRVFGSGLGSYAEQIAVKGASLHHIPKDWDFRDAAGLAATAPVSYGALITRGRLQRGETVLIHAAAGGLGAMAVQISKAVGARVIATASSQAKLDVAKSFGADECVNYETNPEWWKEVLQLTNGKGVDVVYDPVGLVGKSLKCLKQKGRILVIGFAGTEGNIERIATNRILLRQAQIIGYVSRNKLSCLPLTFTSVSV
jgi:NADPH2:quinone reductase